MADLPLLAEEENIMEHSASVPILEKNDVITPASPNTEHFNSGASAVGVIITIIIIIIVIVLIIWAIFYFNHGGYVYAAPAYGYYGGGGYVGNHRGYGYGRGDSDRSYREGNHGGYSRGGSYSREDRR
jgi:hypothetical protein